MRLVSTSQLVAVVSATAIMVSASPFAAGQTQTQRGATWGGLAGAVAGGIIGDNNDEAGAGAAIGGVIGAVAGGILGNADDKQRVARQQQYYYQQQQIQSQRIAQVQSAVSISDIINMSRSGLSDSVIINQIHQRGVQQQLGVPDIINMHQQGVREPVITAMQQARVGGSQVVARPAAAPQPVVVQQPVVVRQPTVIHETHVLPSYPVRRYYYPPRRHYHGGIRVGF